MTPLDCGACLAQRRRMNIRSRGSLLIPLATALPLLALPGSAAAQSVTIVGRTSLPRLDRNSVNMPKRPLPLRPEGVNSQDCLDDQRIRVPLQLVGFEANAVLEAWASVAGVDCSAQANRLGNRAVCWRIHDAIPLQPDVTADIRVRRLLAGAVSASTGEMSAELRACTQLDLTTLRMQFLYFAPGQPVTPVSQSSIDIEVDTIGNPPPQEPKIYAGDTSVELQWRQSADVGNTGIHVYCARLLPVAGDFSCSSPSLPPDTVLDPSSKANLRCGMIVGSSSRSIVGSTADGRPLENGVIYGFGLASVDGFGNVGPLSPTLCGSPRAGATVPSQNENHDGSGCSASPTGKPLRRPGGAVALGMMLTLASAFARRRVARRLA